MMLVELWRGSQKMLAAPLLRAKLGFEMAKRFVTL